MKHTININEFIKLYSSGAKTFKSIRRKYLSMPSDAPIGELNDMVRVTLVTNSFTEVPSIIMELNSLLDGFKGYITEKKSGYTGIHSQFLFNGFRSEIQFTTPLALKAKTADDKRYHQLQMAMFKSSQNNSKSSSLFRKYIASKYNEQINSLIEQENISREIFEMVYEETGLYDQIDVLKALFHYCTAHSELENPISRYSNDLLNSCEKSDKLIMDVAKEAKNAQKNMEAYLSSEMKLFVPQKEITLPNVVDSLVGYDEFLISQLIKNINQSISVKKLEILKDKIMHEYIRQAGEEYDQDLMKEIFVYQLNAENLFQGEYYEKKSKE